MGGPKITEQLGSLCRLLDAEAGGYEALVTLLEKQRQAAMKARFGLFVDTVGEKDALLENLGHLERERLQLMEALSQGLHVPEAQLTVSRLISMLPGPQAEQLNTCRYRLRAVIEQVRVKNKTNQDLLEHLLEWMKKALELLGSKVPGQRTYCKNGQVQATKLTGTVLHGEI